MNVSAPTSVSDESSLARSVAALRRRGPAVRGGAIRLLTSALFYVLSVALPTALAYTPVVARGLAFVAAVTPGYVFGAGPTPARRALLVCWYAPTWLAGLGAISPARGARP